MAFPYYTYKHFARFGLLIHVGRQVEDNNTGEITWGKSKTEIMYIPPFGCNYEDANTDIIYADDGNGIARFTELFKYLGFLLTPELTSTAEVDKRLAAAASAFGQLRKTVFGSKDILYEVKAKIYNALILSILLYGSECWTLSAKDRHRLQLFHRRCVRIMCRVTLRMSYKNRISTKDLLQRLNLKSMNFYINKRCLRWVGHLLRMDKHRLPLQMFFAKLPDKRKRGGQQLSYARRVRQEIKLAYHASTPDIQDEIGDCDDHVNWVSYAGMFATSDEEKDECRLRWRNFISNNNL